MISKRFFFFFFFFFCLFFFFFFFFFLFLFIEKKMQKKKSITSSHLSVIMQLMMLFCVTWVIEFTWTFSDYFDANSDVSIIINFLQYTKTRLQAQVTPQLRISIHSIL